MRCGMILLFSFSLPTDSEKMVANHSHRCAFLLSSFSDIFSFFFYGRERYRSSACSFCVPSRNWWSRRMYQQPSKRWPCIVSSCTHAFRLLLTRFQQQREEFFFKAIITFLNSPKKKNVLSAKKKKKNLCLNVCVSLYVAKKKKKKYGNKKKKVGPWVKFAFQLLVNLL